MDLDYYYTLTSMHVYCAVCGCIFIKYHVYPRVNIHTAVTTFSFTSIHFNWLEWESGLRPLDPYRALDTLNPLLAHTCVSVCKQTQQNIHVHDLLMV